MKSVEIYSVLYVDTRLECFGLTKASFHARKKKKQILKLIQNKSYQLKGTVRGRAR